MWKTFKKHQYTSQKPIVSVNSDGLNVNRAAVLLLLDDVPDRDLDFVILIDREESQIGLRFYDGTHDVDLFKGRRPRTGRKMPDGVRKHTNTWRIHGRGAAAEAGLVAGRYAASFKGVSGAAGAAMIVFGPKPIDS